MNLFRPVVAVLALLMLSCGCSSVKDSALYQDHLSPDLNVRLYDEELVTGAKPVAADRWILVVSRTEDPGVKQMFEDAFVTRLEAAGYKALPAYRVAPAYGEPFFSTSMFRQKAKRLQVSHVVMTGMVSQYDETLFSVRSNSTDSPLGTAVPIPSTSSVRKLGPIPPISDWPTSFAGRPRVKGDYVIIDQSKGRKVTSIDRDSESKVFILETQLLEVGKDDPVWSVKSENFPFNSADQMFANLIDQCLDRMVAANLMASGQ